MTRFSSDGWLRIRNDSARITRLRYFSFVVLGYFSFFSMGLLLALAEYRQWIPCCLSDWFCMPSKEYPVSLSLLGLSFAQSVPIPLLFLAGLHFGGFHNTARLIDLAFWILRGIDTWKLLFVMFSKPQFPFISFCILLLVLSLTARALLMVRSVCVHGLRSKADGAAHTVSEYFSRLLYYWGNMLLLSLAFDLLYYFLS